MEQETLQITKLIGLISSQHFNGIHTVNPSWRTGSNSLVESINVYSDDDFGIRILSMFVIHRLFLIPGTPTTAFTNITQLDYADHIKIILPTFWKFHIMNMEGNGEIITSVATIFCYCTAQTKGLNGMNLFPYFLQSEITNDASDFIQCFTKHGGIFLNNCNMECGPYQGTYCWYLFFECISLIGTEDSQASNVWKVKSIPKIIKFMIYMSDQSGKEHKWFQAKVSKEFTSFPDSTRRCNESSISSNGYQRVFFKRQIKVSSLSQTIDN